MQKSATSLAKDGQRNDAAIGEVRWKYPLGSEHSPRLIRDLHSLSTAQPAGLLQHRANEGRRGRGFGWLHDLFEPYYLAHLFWH